MKDLETGYNGKLMTKYGKLPKLVQFPDQQQREVTMLMKNLPLVCCGFRRPSAPTSHSPRLRHLCLGVASDDK